MASKISSPKDILEHVLIKLDPPLPFVQLYEFEEGEVLMLIKDMSGMRTFLCIMILQSHKIFSMRSHVWSMRLMQALLF